MSPARRAPRAGGANGSAHAHGDPGLDDIDREIIRLLQADGRAPNTAMARALGVTETTVRKRVARLLDERLIEIQAVPMGAVAGMTTSAIFGLSVDLTHLEAVSRAVGAHPEVRYVGVSAGRYDVIVEAFFADKEHLMRFVSDVLGGLEAIRSVETSVILKVEKFTYDWEIP
jgi:Lrp/AsnC family transcriptional regulator for asnA, asnC and gidA